MRLLIQRAAKGSVTIGGEVVGRIGKGLVILVGVTHTDTVADAEYLAAKCVNLRIFTDENGQNKAYIVESVSTDGKTITFSEDTPVVADATYTDGVGANGQAVSLNTSFAVGTVINFSGSDDVAPVMEKIDFSTTNEAVRKA